MGAVTIEKIRSNDVVAARQPARFFVCSMTAPAGRRVDRRVREKRDRSTRHGYRCHASRNEKSGRR